MVPLKSENGYVIASHNLLGMRLIIYRRTTFKLCQLRGPVTQLLIKQQLHCYRSAHTICLSNHPDTFLSSSVVCNLPIALIAMATVDDDTRCLFGMFWYKTRSIPSAKIPAALSFRTEKHSSQAWHSLANCAMSDISSIALVAEKRATIYCMPFLKN